MVQKTQHWDCSSSLTFASQLVVKHWQLERKHCPSCKLMPFDLKTAKKCILQQTHLSNSLFKDFILQTALGYGNIRREVSEIIFHSLECIAFFSNVRSAHKYPWPSYIIFNFSETVTSEINFVEASKRQSGFCRWYSIKHVRTTLKST